MNFLAHLYLSENEEFVMVGNFIADWIKGNEIKKYPEKVQTGILLHRFIDYYTDNHNITLLSRNRVRPIYGKYSGIVIDMFYDHFLAVNWAKYSGENFSNFVQKSYSLMSKNQAIMPERVQFVLPRIIASNRLESYKSIEGMGNALQIMSERTSLPQNTSFGIQILKEQYNELNDEFNSFFPELISSTKIKLNELENKI